MFIQLAGQVHTQSQVISLGGVFSRWRLLEKLCVDHGPRVAKEYDAETWRRAVARIQVGALFEVRSLTEIDQDALRQVKSCVEHESAEKRRKSESDKAGKAGERSEFGWNPHQHG